ncbi:tail fiber assembly protein, partial [Escherichia coli]
GHCMRHLVVLVVEAWKKYRVLLNRVDTSTAPDIEWPTNPVRE